MSHHLAIDGKKLRAMLQHGAALLEENKATVDALNVFPVPDGDTGTNMSLTLSATIREMNACISDNLSDVMAAAARGALKGARGNSGVILSQLFRGFAQKTNGKSQLDGRTLAEAFKLSADMAYKALMKPKEGTILTVARVIGEEAMACCRREEPSPIEVMEVVLKSGEDILKRTPELLPVLKQAGVVDAGGAGLLWILRGFYRALSGDMQLSLPAPTTMLPAMQEAAIFENVEDIQFGYCTEFLIVHLKKIATVGRIQVLRERYDAIGDSVVVVHDGDFIKVHVHTESPGAILQMALELGEISSIKIENMREQNREILEKRKQASPQKPLGLVAVAAGEGLCTLFSDLMADVVIQGGQTMNPSIEEIAEAIRTTTAKDVIVLPNNSNIILAAEHACKLLPEQNVHVIPTRSVTAGIACALAYKPDRPADENIVDMMDAMAKTTDGQITRAVRDSQIADMDVHEGDIMGLINGELKVLGHDVAQTVLDVVSKMVTDQSQIITLIFGDGVQEQQAQSMAQTLRDLYPKCDVEVASGMQPLYPYFLSVE